MPDSLRKLLKQTQAPGSSLKMAFISGVFQDMTRSEVSPSDTLPKASPKASNWNSKTQPAMSKDCQRVCSSNNSNCSKADSCNPRFFFVRVGATLTSGAVAIYAPVNPFPFYFFSITLPNLFILNPVPTCLKTHPNFTKIPSEPIPKLFLTRFKPIPMRPKTI